MAFCTVQHLVCDVHVLVGCCALPALDLPGCLPAPVLQVQVSHDDKGNTSVSYLEYVDVSRPERVKDLLDRAMRQRSVGATAMNEQSSRRWVGPAGAAFSRPLLLASILPW